MALGMTRPSFPSVSFLWPALAAASVSEMASALAGGFAQLATGGESSKSERGELHWTTRNKIAIELPSVRLRDFSTDRKSIPTLVCAPFALHDATITDFAPRHSLVAALRMTRLRHLFVTDWRSATPEMRFFSIDSYLSDLNTVVDELGGTVNLIGLCQGGWIALVYAARFPGKVPGLVLAGAPVDVNAGESELSRFAATVPISAFKRLMQLGGGVILGPHLLQLWHRAPVDSEAIRQVFQISENISSPRNRRLVKRFHEWYASTVDLPGTYYLQVVEWLYKENQLATGRFVALGRRIDLAALRIPIFLLAGRNDDIVAPEQVFAAEHLVRTSAGLIRKEIVPCGHLALFMGAATLTHTWPKIASWLMAPTSTARLNPR
jgi:poly(3-hydroxyalkanoate) synthetase